jgi:5-carboxymethyl-2-hydroxymuconic-semialdehyde dehydrogenase
MIMKQGADTLKRVHFELGGKNPVVVFADADLERALMRCLHDLFAERRALHLVLAACWSGDDCRRSSRLVAERAKRIKVGHPLDPATVVGPLIHRCISKKVPRIYRDRPSRGRDGLPPAATVRSAGRGCFVRPTLFTGANNQMRIAQEEVFGPVLTADPVQGRGRGAGDRQRRPVWPDRLSLDQ